jgi:hypothetical protein
VLANTDIKAEQAGRRLRKFMCGCGAVKHPAVGSRAYRGLAQHEGNEHHHFVVNGVHHRQLAGIDLQVLQPLLLRNLCKQAVKQELNEWVGEQEEVEPAVMVATVT